MNKPEEIVLQVPLEKIMPFPQHPFYVRDDDMMQQLTESIRQVGVLNPVIVRQMADGSYQLISGHRRKYACEILGIASLPVIVRNANEDEATIMMVDSNFQRDVILPSEKARAYKLKLEAIKHQGERTDLTSVQGGQKLERKTSRQIIAEKSPDSSSQIQRYIRLNELIPELLDLVDTGKIALASAAEISYLREAEQSMLLLTIESEQAIPSPSQALRMKKLSRSGLLTDDMILNIMMEQKKADAWNLTLPMNKVAKYFPSTYTPLRMQETIFQLLDQWLARQIKKSSRKERVRG